ncbi:MAG: endolytic transglycosylase MltG, partial [Methyloceanibacter sp.]
HKVTLPEGLTSQQIVARLLAHPELTGEIAEVPPEGSLLPDTYRFGSDDSRKNIIERMQHAQAKFLAKMWEERHPDIMVQTPEEALILASIVEKETGRVDERAHVASVFHNRLKKKMRLQSDPTIIYGLFGGEGMRDHPITRADLDRDTPYNTYKINGLPPTPIGNPGRAAIEAVLKPAKSDYLYFCADGTGGHAFAATLVEHNKNVARWRAIEREIRAKQAAEAAAAAAAAAAADPEAAAAAATSAADPAATAGTEAAAADPGATAGTLAAPEEPPPAAEAAAPAPAPVATGPAVPLPKRKPQR